MTSVRTGDRVQDPHIFRKKTIIAGTFLAKYGNNVTFQHLLLLPVNIIQLSSVTCLIQTLPKELEI